MAREIDKISLTTVQPDASVPQSSWFRRNKAVLAQIEGVRGEEPNGSRGPRDRVIKFLVRRCNRRCMCFTRGDHEVKVQH